MTDLRLTALTIAQDFTDKGDTRLLIKNANLIERHLHGEDVFQTEIITPAPRDKYDWLKPPMNGKPWAGIAKDLLGIFDAGDTMVCNARQIGMTKLLQALAAQKIREGKSVLMISPNLSINKASKDAIMNDLNGDDSSFLHFAMLKDFETDSFRGRSYDLVIVDGLAFLPYAKEVDFMTIIPCCGKRLILCSEPGQERGLFYDLWQNSGYQKVMLTGHTPLYLRGPLSIDRKTMGEESYRSAVECQFRPVKD